jgi:dipeptidyl aminopeptidase/acylaminoacyl peptidase
MPLRVIATDGRTIDAWLTLPPRTTQGARLPLVLQVHGGPYAAFGPAFSSEDQLIAAAGYAVLTVNPRGSTGYGADFANAIQDRYPGPDYDDLMAAVDAAIASGTADPDNLYVTGYSAGGLMTAWIVGQTRRFRAASAQAPIANWMSWRLTTDRPEDYWRLWSAGAMRKESEHWWMRSPLSLLGRIATPTLVVVGEKDHVTGVSEAEQLYTALKLDGVPTALLRFPGAGHGGLATASRPSQAAMKVETMLVWFNRYRTRDR